MRKIIKHLGIILLLSALLIAGALFGVRFYTNHDSDLIEVVDLEGELSQAAINHLSDLGLEGIVTDTVYKDGAKMLTVINQNPVAGLKVKPGRKVYLVINTGKIPMVEVPDLAGKTSLEQAKNILNRRHLKVGNVTKQVNSSVRSKTDKPVLDQYKSGTRDRIKAGSLIERNSKIDLVVGVPSGISSTDSIP